MVVMNPSEEEKEMSRRKELVKIVLGGICLVFFLVPASTEGARPERDPSVPRLPPSRGDGMNPLRNQIKGYICGISVRWINQQQWTEAWSVDGVSDRFGFTGGAWDWYLVAIDGDPVARCSGAYMSQAHMQQAEAKFEQLLRDGVEGLQGKTLLFYGSTDPIFGRGPVDISGVMSVLFEAVLPEAASSLPFRHGGFNPYNEVWREPSRVSVTPGALSQVAAAEAAEGRYQEAYGILKHLSEHYPASSIALGVEGRIVEAEEKVALQRAAAAVSKAEQLEAEGNLKEALTTLAEFENLDIDDKSLQEVVSTRVVQLQEAIRQAERLAQEEEAQSELLEAHRQWAEGKHNEALDLLQQSAGKASEPETRAAIEDLSRRIVEDASRLEREREIERKRDRQRAEERLVTILDEAPALLKRGKIAEAESLIVEADRLFPEDPRVDALKSLYHGKVQERRAAERSTEAGKLLEAGRMLEREGLMKKAALKYSEALGLDPGNRDARIALDGVVARQDFFDDLTFNECISIFKPKYDVSALLTAPDTNRIIGEWAALQAVPISQVRPNGTALAQYHSGRVTFTVLVLPGTPAARSVGLRENLAYRVFGKILSPEIYETVGGGTRQALVVEAYVIESPSF